MKTTHPKLPAVLDEVVRWLVEDQVDISVQAQACKDTIELLQQTINRVADVRSSAIRALWAEGWSQREIARAFELSPARIDQIIKR